MVWLHGVVAWCGGMVWWHGVLTWSLPPLLGDAQSTTRCSDERRPVLHGAIAPRGSCHVVDPKLLGMCSPMGTEALGEGSGQGWDLGPDT